MMENMSLFKIDSAVKQILDEGFTYNEETGEIYFTEDDLDALNMRLEEKVNNIIGYIKQTEAFAAALKSSEADFKQRRVIQENRAERLKKYLKAYLENNGKTKIEAENGTASFRKSTKLNIQDEEKLRRFLEEDEDYRERFLKTKEPEIAKSELKKAIKDNYFEGLGEVPGVSMDVDTNLTIK